MRRCLAEVSAWLLSILVALSVEGDATCPAPARVQERLEGAQLPAHRATLTQSSERTVELVLLDERGAPLAARSLSAGTCVALEEAAAATLLAWEATLPPAAAAAARPPRRATLPARATGSVDDVAEPGVIAWRFELALAGAVVGRGLAPGLALAAQLGPRSWRVHGRIQLSSLAPVETVALPGRVAWARPAIGVGVAATLLTEPFSLEAAATFEQGVLVAWGSGFEQNRIAYAYDPSAEVSVRAGLWGIGPLQLFAQAAVGFSLLQRELQVGGIGFNVAVPPVTAALRLGAAVGP